jgi:hypothetical protein
MAIKVEVSDEQFDRLVRQELENCIKIMYRPDYDVHETAARKTQLLGAFYTVLEFYSTKEEFESFLMEIWL